MIDKKAEELGRILDKRRRRLIFIALKFLFFLRESLKEAEDIFGQVSLHVINEKDMYASSENVYLDIVSYTRNLVRRRIAEIQNDNIIFVDSIEDIEHIYFDILKIDLPIDPHNRFELKEVSEYEWKCAKSLREPYRTTYILRKFYYMEYEDISLMLGASEPTIRQRFSRATKMVIECLRNIYVIK